LEQIINTVPGIQVGGYVENHGIDLFRLARKKGLEGIIAKRKTSTYRPGKRSPDWLKIKARPQQEFVVCGSTEGQGGRKHFGALLLGGYGNGRLRYFDHSGTGFSEKGSKEAIDRLKRHRGVPLTRAKVQTSLLCFRFVSAPLCCSS
jgi:bifunctional non-homologous end joining protein LigD